MVSFDIHMKPILVRFETRLYELIRKVSTARGEDMADFIRLAVKTQLANLSYLNNHEKKALGILPRVMKQDGQERSEQQQWRCCPR